MSFIKKTTLFCQLAAVCCLLLAGCQQSGVSSYSEPNTSDAVVSIPDLEQTDSAFRINIDSVSNAEISGGSIYVSSDSGRIAISGWAVSPAGDDSLSSIYAKVGGNVYRGSYGVCRNDVAQMLGHIETVYCGFVFDIPASAFLNSDGNIIDKIGFYGVSHDLGSIFMPVEFDVIFGDPVQTSESDKEAENTAALPDIEQKEESVSVCVDQCNGAAVGFGGEIKLSGQDDTLSISGWALNEALDETLSALYIIAGDKTFAADYGQPRSDVAENYGHDDCADCGFTFELSLSELRGTDGSFPQTIDFVGVSADGSYLTKPAAYSISQ